MKNKPFEDAMKIGCPLCGAKPKNACMSVGKKSALALNTVHNERLRAAGYGAAQDFGAHVKPVKEAPTFKDFLEGFVKRSHPVISGEVDGKMPWEEKKKQTPFSKKIENLAKAANVSPDKVRDIWSDELRKVDRKNPNYFAIVTNNVKKVLSS